MPIKLYEFFNSKGNLLGSHNSYSKGLHAFSLAEYCMYYENGYFKSKIQIKTKTEQNA